MYAYEIKPELEKSLQKLAKKDKRHYESVVRKILQITDNPKSASLSEMFLKVKEGCI